MVTAVPACFVPTRQAADSGTKALGWSFREEKNFVDTEAKLQRQFIPKSCSRKPRQAGHEAQTPGGKKNLLPADHRKSAQSKTWLTWQENHLLWVTRFHSQLRLQTVFLPLEKTPIIQFILCELQLQQSAADGHVSDIKGKNAALL